MNRVAAASLNAFVAGIAVADDIFCLVLLDMFMHDFLIEMVRQMVQMDLRIILFPLFSICFRFTVEAAAEISLCPVCRQFYYFYVHL